VASCSQHFAGIAKARQRISALPATGIGKVQIRRDQPTGTNECATIMNENRISLQRAENDCKKYLLQLKQLINTNADFTPKDEKMAKLHDANLGKLFL
jgi:hypothetical protein